MNKYIYKEMKHLNQFITEYIIKKKLDKPIDSEDHYEYHPKTKGELIDNIIELVEKNIYNFNCINTSKIKDMSYLFDDFEYVTIKENFDISRWNVSNVENMCGMLDGCKYFNCDLSNWDVSNVENMEQMFYRCESFEGKGLENWNVSNVKRMDMIFSYCINFDGKSIENWDISNLKSTRNMFYYCIKFNANLSNWDVSNIKRMISMFAYCKSFKGKGLENWNVSNVEYMNYIFNGCTSLKNKPSWYKG